MALIIHCPLSPSLSLSPPSLSNAHMHSRTAPEDYADPDRQLTFGPGNMFVDIEITIVDDLLVEGLDIFRLLLSIPEQRVNLNPNTTQISILDDDGRQECVCLA